MKHITLILTPAHVETLRNAINEACEGLQHLANMDADVADDCLDEIDNYEKLDEAIMAQLDR